MLAIKEYEKLIGLLNNQIIEYDTIREKYDIEKVNLLDRLMDVVHEYSFVKKHIPNVKIISPKKEEIKKQLKEKLKVHKQEKKKIEKPKIQVNEKEMKRNEQLERIKNFRKELEELQKQIIGL